MKKIIKLFRKLFNLSQPYENDELVAKWLEMKKPKGSDKDE